MNLRNLLLTTLVCAVGVFAQNPITTDSPFQVRYATNVDAGESYVNITNTGAIGAGLAALQVGQNPASVTGAICANVYVFSPDEQMVACCACPVTPNGIANLGVNRDLISNVLTPVRPSSVVVKLLASVPVGGTCNPAAPGALAVGMRAWGTTLHANNGGFDTTETPFAPVTLSGPGTGANIGELARLTNLCTFIQANGSTFGICRACRLGALGAARR
jgi:hypothetical protein